MRKYMVKVKMTSSDTLFVTIPFDTLESAIEYVEDQQAEDAKCGESDDYEYEIINPNK